MELNNWYEESFGKDYLSIYAHRDDREAEDAVKDIIKLTGAKEDWPLLDLCCGTGRHLRAFQRAGYKKLYGIDLSIDLLKQVSCENITYIQGDMRHIPFRKYFHLVLSLFTSFGYFFSDSQNLKVLEEVKFCLFPGGTFLLDYMNRSYIEKNLISEDTVCNDGKEIISKRWISSDNLRVEKEVKIIEKNEEKIYHESVRLFTFSELYSLLKKAGFTDINYYVNSAESPRITFTGRKEK
jgi:SAM-dependent methyltransferase